MDKVIEAVNDLFALRTRDRETLRTILNSDLALQEQALELRTLLQLMESTERDIASFYEVSLDFVNLSLDQ